MMTAMGPKHYDKTIYIKKFFGDGIVCMCVCACVRETITHISLCGVGNDDLGLEDLSLVL